MSQVCQAEGTQVYVKLKDMAEKVGTRSADAITEELFECSKALYNSDARTTAESFVFSKESKRPHYYHDRKTWNGGIEFCKSKGARLCTYDEICHDGKLNLPEGVNLKTGHDDPAQWLPYSGDASSICKVADNGLWLNSNSCQKHKAVANKCPEWGKWQTYGDSL